MLVPNRHGSSNSYRYGFNGKEKDDELKGEGNSYDYGFRMYDPRIGRFFNIDPLAAKFPSWSPFAYAFNNPILNIDLEGLEGLANSHRIYFANAGFNLFKKVTSDEVGFSPLGAAFALGQSAWESGYGNEADINKKVKANNYWGMKFKGKVINHSSFDKGFASWQTMMTNRFKGAYDLLKGNFTIDELEKAINYGDYSYDPLTKGKYVKHMLSNAKNVLKRGVKILDEEISALRNEASKMLKDKNETVKGFDKLSEDEQKKYNSLINQVNSKTGLKSKMNESIKAVDEAMSKEN
jgi:RHS repeat-associated protein